mmetsp:Transcript_1078/g.2529  ORF Transcript_1078/g.2529 Transcript_1078/m.2529 type:complete len:224 (-) Transcript_1078:4202-4873(-)
MLSLEGLQGEPLFGSLGGLALRALLRIREQAQLRRDGFQLRLFVQGLRSGHVLFCLRPHGGGSKILNLGLQQSPIVGGDSMGSVLGGSHPLDGSLHRGELRLEQLLLQRVALLSPGVGILQLRRRQANLHDFRLEFRVLLGGVSLRQDMYPLQMLGLPAQLCNRRLQAGFVLQRLPFGQLFSTLRRLRRGAQLGDVLHEPPPLANGLDVPHLLRSLMPLRLRT